MRIVTVDDSQITAPELKSRLTSLGHEVVAHAFNGQHGVEMCRKHRPDVAIFDILMPLMTGDKAAQIVSDEGTATHIVLATSQGQQFAKDLADRNGWRMIVKPYSIGQLQQALEGL